MRRIIAIILSVFMLLAIAACDALPVASSADTVIDTPEVSAEVSVMPEPSVTTEGVLVEIKNDERAEIFRNFIKDNFAELSKVLYGGIAGVGFADLDCDGGMEMILFDAGASASMGVQFFDIIDSKVECISANISTVGESFGGEHLTEIFVNANYFDDFRLMEDKSGEKFFLVKSGNGALDFSYTDYIRFGRDGDVLTLTSVAYIYQDFDTETSEVIGTKYKVDGKESDKESYDDALNKLNTTAVDTNLEVKGVFVYKNDAYTEGLDGLLKMVDDALSAANGQIDLH